jgi:hypothetical protein
VRIVRRSLLQTKQTCRFWNTGDSPASSPVKAIKIEDRVATKDTKPTKNVEDDKKTVLESLKQQRQNLLDERSALYSEILERAAASDPKLRELNNLILSLGVKCYDLQPKLEEARNTFTRLGGPNKIWKAEQVINQACGILSGIEIARQPLLQKYRKATDEETLAGLQSIWQRTGSDPT